MAGAPAPAGSTFGIPNNSSLAQPGQVLSGQALIDAAKALANAQTQGPLTELARQIAQNNAQGAQAQKITSQQFDTLGKYMQQGEGDIQNIGSGLNSTLAGIANDTNSRLAGVQSEATANMAKYSPGGSSFTNPAMQSLTTELARQQGLAAQNEGAFRAAGALQGANQAGLQANMMGAYSTRGQEMLGDIARATKLENAPLTSKMAALKAQEGALFATDLGKLRQQEITNQDTAKGLGIKEQQVQQTAADNAAKIKLGYAQINAANWRNQQTIQGDWQRNQATIAAANARNEADHASALTIANLKLAATNPGGVKPLSTVDNNKMLNLLGKIIGLVGYYRQQGVVQNVLNPTTHKMEKTIVRGDQAIKQTLKQGLDGSGNLTQAAYELLGWGYVTQSTANALKNMGINIGVGTFRGKPIRVVADSAVTGDNSISPGARNSPH